MKQIVLAIRDAKIEEFLPPTNFRTKAEGMRRFADTVNQEGTDFNKWPEDFALFELGVFDTETGKTENAPQPFQLCTGLDVVEQFVPSTQDMFPVAVEETA